MKYRIADYIQFTVCFLFLCIASTAFIFFSFNYNTANKKVVDFEGNNIDSLFLRVSDVYGREGQKSLSEFFDEKNSLQRMKQFCSVMHDQYDFLEFDKQALLIKKDFNYKDEFRIDYESEYYGINDHIGVSLNSVQMGETTYQSFDLEGNIIRGSGFGEQSFKYDSKAPIEVILGYEYLDILNIGDIIEANYLSKDIPLKVIGFFKKDMSITVNNQLYFLDRYITMPFIGIDENVIPANENDERFQKILYSLKTWGYIKISDGEDFYTYQENVEQISGNLNLKYVLNEGYINPYITNVANTLDSTKGVLLIVSAILFVALVIVCICVYLWNYNRNKKNHAIKLICGCSLHKLKREVCSSIFVNFILSSSVAILINKAILVHNNTHAYERMLLNQSIGQFMVIEILIMLIVFWIINSYINKSNVYSVIKK